jgi:phage gp29-like protein
LTSAGGIQMSVGCARVSAQDQSLSLQLDALYVQWDPPRLYEIETDEEFSLEDRRQERGRSKLTALGWVKHSDVPKGIYD